MQKYRQSIDVQMDNATDDDEGKLNKLDIVKKKQIKHRRYTTYRQDFEPDKPTRTL